MPPQTPSLTGEQNPALDIATVTSANDPTWRRDKKAWPEFVTWFDDPADVKDCGGYVMGRWGSPKRHPGDIIESRSAVTLDADDKARPNLPDQVEALGYSAVIHTTWRSTPDKLRFRVVILLDRPVTPTEYVIIAGHLMDLLGREQFDKCSLETGRIMFLPSVPPEHPDWYRKWVVGSVPAPVNALLLDAALALSGSAEAPKAAAPGVPTNTAPAAPEDWVQDKVDDLLSSLDNLADLPDGPQHRLPWKGVDEGIGWDLGGLLIAGQLIEAANSGSAYTMERAKADFFLHSPPKSGSYDPCHKWEQALKHVGGAPLPGSPAADFNAVTTATASTVASVHSGQILMAQRLAAAYTGKLLYVKGIGWHYRDGKRWAEDARGHAERAVVKVLRDAILEGTDTGNKKLRANAQKCESSGAVAGVLTLASKMEEFAKTVDDMDPYPWLINCENGTLNLHTRELQPHDPADWITKITQGAYDPDADQTVWLGFLKQIMPDQKEREYLQKVIGQSAYGAVREHLFPVLTGVGANGKGTCYGALVFAFGDYAAVIKPDLLMVSRNGSSGPEMMVLRGARLVVASELGKDKVLDDALMKRLTGGDELTARHLYQKPVSWKPTHQLLYVTNYKPRTAGDDDAVWRRMKVVPFDVVILEADRDPELGEMLTLHASAILTWAIQGYFDYKDHGMREPASVKEATDAYQHESDPVARFVEDRCEKGRGLQDMMANLYLEWERWCQDDRCEPGSKRAFGAALEKRGYRGDKVGKAHSSIRHGLRLCSESENDA